MIKSYAAKNYEKMFRHPEGQLKHPFIVPGSVYANQLWDWDCWLTNVALRQFAEKDITAYERGCVIRSVYRPLDSCFKQPVRQRFLQEGSAGTVSGLYEAGQQPPLQYQRIRAGGKSPSLPKERRDG